MTAAQANLDGFDGLDKLLRRLPDRMAEDLQRTLVREAVKAKRAVADRSRMSAAGKRAIRARDGIVKIDPREKTKPRRLRDVYLDFYSTWQGAGVPTRREAIARQIEEEVGGDEYRPTRRRRLLIPTGDYLTPGGRPRRRGGRKLDPAEAPNARVVPIGRGRLLLVQALEGGVRGDLERTRGVRKKDLGERERVIGILVPKVDISTSLDFFGAWSSLESSRSAAFGQLLDRALRRM